MVRLCVDNHNDDAWSKEDITATKGDEIKRILTFLKLQIGLGLTFVRNIWNNFQNKKIYSFLVVLFF